MEKILPPDPQVCRQFARFLGEKSLSLEERQKYLARAEWLEFQRAKRDFRSGELELFNLRIPEAFRHFQSALNLLKSIQFYQNLLGQDFIDDGDYVRLLRSTWLNLAKCRTEDRAGWSEVERYLLQYLALEDRPKEVSDLEAYLRRREILPRESGKAREDLNRLAFELLLWYKQNKYRDIVSIGREIESNLIVVPEMQKDDLIRVLLLIGDSRQKLDFLYDAGDTYQRALKVNPVSLGTLLRLRQNYDRLGQDGQVQEIDRLIERLTARPEISPGSSLIDKGKSFTQRLVLEGKRICLDLRFGDQKEGNEPLVSILFNGQVVWEQFLKDNLISLNTAARAGDNLLQIVAVNRPVTLSQFSCRRSEVANDLMEQRSRS
jgi:hypothetical protein